MSSCAHDAKTCSNCTCLSTSGKSSKNLSAQQASKFFGVTGKTLREWHSRGYITAGRTPGNQRIYDVNSIVAPAGNNDSDKKTTEAVVAGRRQSDKENFIYARVSSAKQQGDLERQIQALSHEFSGYKVVSDVGSGINFKRPGLQKLIKRCVRGDVGRVVVAHRDRLCRIAFDFFEFLFKTLGVELVVHDKDDGVQEGSELGEDLMAIVHVFSARHYGKRRYGATISQETKSGSRPLGPCKKRGRPRKLPCSGADEQQEEKNEKVRYAKKRKQDRPVCQHPSISLPSESPVDNVGTGSPATCLQ